MQVSFFLQKTALSLSPRLLGAEAVGKWKAAAAAAAAGAAAAFGGASWLLQAATASSLLFVCQTASEQANKQRTGLK
jgi:hypothetical protein